MKTVKELMGLEEAEKMKGEDPCWDTHQMVGMKMKNGRKVPNCVPKAKNEEVELNEGRPSQRHPLEGHEYHKKTDAQLEYIAKDANKAAEAMKSHDTDAENKYRDQANDSATVRYWRKKNGMPDWYKKKYGHMKEEFEIAEAKVGDTVSFHHELKSAPGSKVKKSGTVEKIDGEVVHVKVKDKYGVKRHQIKMSDLVKEEVESVAEGNEPKLGTIKANLMNTKTPTVQVQVFKHNTLRGDSYWVTKEARKFKTMDQAQAYIDRINKQGVAEEVELDEVSQDALRNYFKKSVADLSKRQIKMNTGSADSNDAKKMQDRKKGLSRASDKIAAKMEEVEHIDELNKDTLYSYTKKADADIEKKHKSLGQLMRKGDAPGANKAAHQLNKRVAGMERAETRLNKEEVELEEGEGIVTPKNKLPFTDPPKGSYAWDVRYGNITKRGSYRKKPNPNKPPVKEDMELSEISAALADKVSAARRKQADDSSKKDSYVKPSAETVAKKKKAVQAHASWIKRMVRDNTRSKSQAEISKGYADDADRNYKRGLSNEEVKLEEAEEVKKAKMTPQERAYKRKLGLKAVVQEAIKTMKDKKGDPSQTKDVKKGEALSGKQEPINVNPVLQEK